MRSLSPSTWSMGPATLAVARVAATGTAVETADSFVGQTLAAIASRPNFASKDWQIVVTADGGHRPGGGHGGQSDLERNLPFIVASKNLNQGNLTQNFLQVVSQADASPTSVFFCNLLARCG